MTTTTAQPFYGLEPFVLGRSRAQIKAAAGEPDYISDESFVEGSAQESWHYQSVGVELDFLADEGWRLASITVESSSVSIKSACFVGMAASKLLEAAVAAGINDLALAEETEGEGTCYLSDAFGLMIWVANDAVVNVTLFPEYDETGERAVWPD